MAEKIGENTTISVSDSNWQELQYIRIDEKLNTMDDVISLLIKINKEYTKNKKREVK